MPALGWLLALVVGLVLALGARQALAAEVTALRVERAADGLLLNAQVAFELPAAADDALHKGIPLSFVAEAALTRDRWYWYDKEVSTVTRHLRLSYQPLTRRWRLLVSASPIGSTGLALGQNFDSREEALAAVQRIAGWKIADLAELDADSRYAVTLRFRLDVSQLPRPFQLGAVGQSDWNLAASRSLRLPPEALR